MHCDKWHGTKEKTWYPEIYRVWECRLELGDSARLPKRNDIWEGRLGLVN